jgi:hypothetical protein
MEAAGLLHGVLHSHKLHMKPILNERLTGTPHRLLIAQHKKEQHFLQLCEVWKER